jgi:hypothetical protein
VPDWDNTESRESDEDAAWRDLVARFEAPAISGQPAPWPEREDTGPAARETRGSQGVEGTARGSQGAEGTARGSQGAEGTARGSQGAEETEGARGGAKGAHAAEGKHRVEGASGANGAEGKHRIEGASGANRANGADGVQEVDPRESAGGSGAGGTAGPRGDDGMGNPDDTAGGTAGPRGDDGMGNPHDTAAGTAGPRGDDGIGDPDGAGGVWGMRGGEGIWIHEPNGMWAAERAWRGSARGMPQDDPDDEHFVPPTPPPLPRLDPVTKGAWAALFGGPGYLVLATAAGWSIPALAAFCAVAAFVAGFAVLVLRMHGPDTEGPEGSDDNDDGAVV